MINPIFDKNSVNLVVNCSNEFVPYMDVCLQSVLNNSKEINNYDIIVLESTISETNKNYLTLKYTKKNFKIRFFNPLSVLQLNKIADTVVNYSKESFYKIIVPKLFSKYKKIIYADVDIVFNCDISEIQNIDLQGSPIAATRDFALSHVAKYDKDNRLRDYLKNTIQIKNLFDYFAAGLIVFNIENFTENDVENMLTMAYNFQFWLQEQDVFNKYFNERIYELPYKYCINTAYINKFNKEFFEDDNDYENYKDAAANPKVIHYSGEKKPWHRILDDRYEKMWWTIANTTKFYEQFIFDLKIQGKYLVIIWEKARHLEDEILNRMSQQFKILKKFAIQWDENKFHDNIYSFGGGCLVNSNFHEHHKGKGEFLMVLVEDENEKLEYRQTAQDKMIVNKNVFDFKYGIRAELLNNMCSLHVSNNIKETRHDFALLTGQSLLDFIDNNVLDGETVYLKQNLPCVDGWKDLKHIFYILNETVDYAVLRNFAGLPDEVIVDEHTDIDILVDDMQNFISVMEGAKLRDNIFKIRVYANIQGAKALFHCKYIGDDYYDRKWQKQILQNRIQNEKKIYIPNDAEYFYSLLYHALYQKTYVSNTYLPIFKDLMQKLNLGQDITIENLKRIIEQYLISNNYKITQPYENLDPDLHVSDTLLGRANIAQSNMIDNENDYYIVRGKHGISIFNKKLVGIDSKTATRFILFNEENRFEPFVNWSYKLYKIDAPELKKYRKYIKQGTLFVTFRKRFGHVAMTACEEKNGKRMIEKKWLNYPFARYRTKTLKINTKEKREYIIGKTVTDILKTLKESETEKILDKFIGLVFDKFKTRNFHLLSPKSIDMTTDNCLIDEKGQFKFIDFEYESRKPVEKSFLLYRIIKYCSPYIDHKKYYDLYCKKLLVENKYYYWENIENNLFYGINSTKRNYFMRLLICFIPQKERRRKFRSKYGILNYHLLKNIFGKENIDD